MTATRVMKMLLVILAIAGWSNAPIYAGTMTLTIDFGGQCASMTTSGDPSTAALKYTIVAAGQTKTCGNYVIKPKSTGDVTLETGVDSGDDTLTLKNAKITKAAGSWPDLHITIKGENKYEPTPSGIPGGPSVGYKITGNGFFKRGGTNNLATGSYIKTRGFQQNPTMTAPWFWFGSQPPSNLNGTELVWQVCGTSGCSNYLPSTYEAHSVWDSTMNLAVTRDLKAEFWVKLNDNTDALNLTELKAYHYMAGGGEPEEDLPPGCPIQQCVPCQENSNKCKHDPDRHNP
jgi:hypothetical protein